MTESTYTSTINKKIVIPKPKLKAKQTQNVSLIHKYYRRHLVEANRGQWNKALTLLPPIFLFPLFSLLSFLSPSLSMYIPHKQYNNACHRNVRMMIITPPNKSKITN